MCRCGICEQVMCICSCVHPCMLIWRPEVDAGCLCPSFTTLFFETDLSPNLELAIWLDRWPANSKDPPMSAPPSSTRLQTHVLTLVFCMCAGDLNSGPPACTKSTLPTASIPPRNLLSSIFLIGTYYSRGGLCHHLQQRGCWEV